MLPAFLSPELGLIFWQLVIFLLVLFLLAKFAWKPILLALKEREDSRTIMSVKFFMLIGFSENQDKIFMKRIL